MKERPILFSAPMVRAILEGRKTMTRRIMKPQPDDDGKVTVREIGNSRGVAYVGNSTSGGIVTRVPRKYGQPGDRLWVRETWARWAVDQNTHDYIYRASCNPGDTIETMVRWRPSIYMPRIASRIILEITDVRVERLQEITRKDAVAEGCVERSEDGAWLGPEVAFCRLWESINGQGSWDANPWVWVVCFKAVK